MVREESRVPGTLSGTRARWERGSGAVISPPRFLGAGHCERSPKSHLVSFFPLCNTGCCNDVPAVKRKASYLQSTLVFFPGVALMASLQGPNPNWRLESLGMDTSSEAPREARPGQQGTQRARRQLCHPWKHNREEKCWLRRVGFCYQN